MRNIVFLTGLLTVFSILPAVAPAQQQFAQPKHSPLKETFHREAPVSGRVVAGVLITATGEISTLRVLPPHMPDENNICIQMVSRDGRYWSENTFELPAGVGGESVLLAYPSPRKKYLQELDFDDLAILGSPGECGGVEGDAFFLAGTKTRHSGSSISVFVNAGRADTFISVKNDDHLKDPNPCKKIEEGRRTGFDTICEIDRTGLDQSLPSLDVRILRRHFERMLPPTEFTLLLPR